MSTSTTSLQGGGILPPQTLKSLDDFMDYLNQGGGGGGVSTAASTTTSYNSGSVYILLVGTNEGVPLSRSYGSTNPTDIANTNVHPSDYPLHLSDELISSVETIWATLPSSMQPSNRATMMMNAPPPIVKETNSSSSSSSMGRIVSAHPLLKHIGLGLEVQSTIAYYDDSCILVHIHYAPLVITFIASHDANIGKIQQNIGRLKQILEPVQKALVEIMIQTNKYS
jgi:hypothetical protein